MSRSKTRSRIRIDRAGVNALRAPFASARIAALKHLEIHGLKVPELGAEIARRLGDDDEEVRRQALRTFVAVGKHAVAAVPALIDAVGSGDPDLRRRALQCMAVLGRRAQKAAPRIAELLGDPEHAATALEALVAVAPEHPALPRALGDALFAPEFDAWSRAADQLTRVEGRVIDRVVDRVVDVVRTGSGAEHARAVRLLGTLAALRPDEMLPVTCELLEEDEPERVRPALAALALMGPAALPALPGVLARLRKDPEARDAALDAIAAMGPDAARAVPVLCELVVERGDLGLVSASARTLRAVRPDGMTVVPILAQVLRTGVSEMEGADWWALSEVAESIGAIGHDVPEAAFVLDEILGIALGARAKYPEEAVELAEALLRGIAALGREARRALPTLLDLLQDPQLGKAAAAAIPSIDESDRCKEEVTAAGFRWPRAGQAVADIADDQRADADVRKLALADDGRGRVSRDEESAGEGGGAGADGEDGHAEVAAEDVVDEAPVDLAIPFRPDEFDEGDGPRLHYASALRAATLPADVASEMEPARASARKFAGVGDSAPAEEIVRSIEWALDQAPANQSEDELWDLAYELGVLWGDQVVRAAGWQWAEIVWDEGSAPAIVSPDHTHACFPARFLADAIEGARIELVTRVFERIRAGDLPAARSGALAIVG